MDNSNKESHCYHQSVVQYDEFEDESTGEICYVDFEICKECNAVILNDKVIGYDRPLERSDNSSQAYGYHEE